MLRLLKYVIILATLFVAIDSFDLRAISGGVIISQVQTRSLIGDGSASEELIEIYNNSDFDIDISGWCLKYGSAVESTEAPKLEPNPSRTIKCFTAEDNQVLFLPARSYIILVSSVFSTSHPDFGFDYEFSATLADTNRWLAIYDVGGKVVDLVEWGDLVSSDTAEGGRSAQPPALGYLLSRLETEPGWFQDTNINFDDFTGSAPRENYFYGSLYEAIDICLNLEGFQDEADIPTGYLKDGQGNCFVDICLNLDGLQSTVPVGYSQNENNECLVDVCINLDGLQTVVPIGLTQDEQGGCWADECPNLVGIQKTLPLGYKIDQAEKCVLDIFPLHLTELLANPNGSDYGNEYIEIFNPTKNLISLRNYLLSINSSKVRDYAFPDGAYIEPGSYLAVYNHNLKFTLVNTDGQVILKTIENKVIDESPAYKNPKEGQAWSLLDNAWQYTNQPTPGLANLPNLIAELEDSSLAPCGPNQYRNPLTNRCKLLPEYESQLVSCKEGQYRSEVTNRCRNIISDVIEYIPCPEGQERNPETNRCRKIQVKAPLASCPEGEERNPETNRCRKIVKMTSAGYAPKREEQKSDDVLLAIILSALGLIALTYGLWEWRYEFKAITLKIIKLARRV